MDKTSTSPCVKSILEYVLGIVNAFRKGPSIKKGELAF